MKLFENTTQKEPAITFILGNGFDRSLYMKTAYEHVYDTYVDTPSRTNVIDTFKSELRKRKKYGKWSDFEMGMAEYAKTLLSEDKFVECVRDFKQHMVEHLRKEEKQLESLVQSGFYDSQIIRELERSFEKFHCGFSPNIKKEFERLTDNDFWNYNVITFNYTKSLEYLHVAKYRNQKIIMNQPLHIHGELDNDVVLGVSNVEQIKSTAYKITKKGCRAFVKTIFNEQYDIDRVLTAKRMLESSTIICAYGFSLGESDQLWVDLIVEWLKKDMDHHLVVYEHDTTTYNRCVYDELMEIEDEKREKLMRRLGITDSDLENQIHIPVGYDIFNFEFKKVEESRLPQRHNIFEQ